jgi:hypothetical protein
MLNKLRSNEQMFEKQQLDSFNCIFIGDESDDKMS